MTQDELLRLINRVKLQRWMGLTLRDKGLTALPPRNRPVDQSHLAFSKSQSTEHSAAQMAS